MAQKAGITIRFSDAILRRIDAFVEKGAYEDRSEYIRQAVYYQLNRDELRRDFKDEILLTAQETLRKVLHEPLFIHKIEIMMKTMIMMVFDEMDVRHGKPARDGKTEYPYKFEYETDEK
ncbi:MAG: hypothetical protein JXA44_04110 [Methanospirillaceae archaeon]|nr:hypothetical protein [Methanospirillaceae archaeon]